MANPQRENGHIDIANEIAEQLAKTQLSGYESRVLWVLWRKTYGWHKRSDKISISQFSMVTGIPRRHIHKTLQKLVDRNIVTKNCNSFITKWAFQKDYSRWKVVTKNCNSFITKWAFQKDYSRWKVVTENCNTSKPLQISTATVTENGNKLVTDFGAHKRKERKNTKEINTTKSSLQELNINHIMILYQKKFPEQRKLYGMGGIIRVREYFEGVITTGISIEDIIKAINKANDSAPWNIIKPKKPESPLKRALRKNKEKKQ